MILSTSITERAEPTNVLTSSQPKQPSLVVLVKESETEAWKETTKIVSASRSGAGFTLTRPCTAGRLVLLQAEFPRELRVYDHDARVYSVIGLVQYCKAIPDTTLYDVGVGFIGNKTPDSFKKDARQNYRIVGAAGNGLWQIAEVFCTFKERKHPRYHINIPIQVTVLNERDKTCIKDRAVTLNIGLGGASVVTTISGNVGEKVKFSCPLFDFYSMATIRGTDTNQSGQQIFFLQFLDSEFPVNRMITGQTQFASGETSFFYC